MEIDKERLEILISFGYNSSQIAVFFDTTAEVVSEARKAIE